MQTKVKKKQPAPAPLTQPMVQRQLAGAVDAGAFQHRDPLWHVTESFQQTFDRIGRRRAAQLTLESEGGAGLSAVLGGFSAETARQQQEAARPGADRSAQRGAAPTRERKAQYHPELPQGPIQTFSETAFQRGNLAASVLQGTGRMMLATCLKRSLGQGEPNQQRQTLFGAGSQARTVPGSSPDQMVFYRGFAQSAVGLVVDVLADARAVVDSLTEMAQGTGSLKEDEGAATLRRVYPFLDDSREQQLLAGYQAQLAAADDEREAQLEVTDQVLAELGCGDIPQITVYNKCDKAGAVPFQPGVLLTSARTGRGLDALLQKLDQALADRVRAVKLLLPYDKLSLAEAMRSRGSVTVEDYREDGVYFEGFVKSTDLHLYLPYLVK